MKKVLIIALAAIAIIAITLNVYKKETSTSGKPVVKIGFSTALTGNLASIGIPNKQAAELALHDLNKKNIKYKYEIIFEDHGFDVKKAVMINHKFLQLDRVDAIVDSTSKIGYITAPAAADHQIIHINTTAFDPGIADGKYNFLYRTLSEKEVEKMISKIEKLGIKKVAIITAQDQGMESFSSELKRQLTRIGVKYDEVSIHHTTTDVSFLINKLKQENYDLYCLLTYQPSLELFLKRFREAKINKPITTMEQFDSVQNVALIEGEWYVSSSTLTPENEKRFQKYKNIEMIFGVGNAYDAIMLIAEVFERAPTKPEAYKELQKIKEYNGVIGRVVQDPPGVFQSKAVIKKIINGKAVLLEE